MWDKASREWTGLFVSASPGEINYTKRGSSLLSCVGQLLILLSPLHGEVTKPVPHTPREMWRRRYIVIEISIFEARQREREREKKKRETDRQTDRQTEQERRREKEIETYIFSLLNLDNVLPTTKCWTITFLSTYMIINCIFASFFPPHNTRLPRVSPPSRPFCNDISGEGNI